VHFGLHEQAWSAMSQRSVLRITPGAEGVSIWSSEIFGAAQTPRIHEFLSRAFAVEEVESVELRRATSFGRISYRAVANPAQIWKKLSRALSLSDDATASSGLDAGPARRLDPALLYLDGKEAMPVRVSRVGVSLSTWRVKHQSETALRLWHPLLRNRPDRVFRLEEELAALFGIEDFRASALTGSVSIRFDKRALTVERLAAELEKAWPRLLQGLDGPPSQKRFVAAGGLLGLAVTGQYLVPALRPVALAGAALYSFPNVVKGVKELTRGQLGLPALYSTGLAFMLLSGLPLASTVSAVLMQFWPQLVHRKLARSQRRLFAGQRRRPVWARIAAGNAVEIEVNVAELRKDDRVVVRSGEIVPVDGVVEAGSAVIVQAGPFGAGQLEDSSAGDTVCAGAFVRDGSLTIQVERAGPHTAASFVDSLLPHQPLAGTPALLEAERIANRNAKPALALSALSLLLTRILQPSQAVIRPDYATAPRLSAQLSTLHGLARGLQEGVLFRNPAALDRLTQADVYVFDDSAGIAHRRVEVAAVQAIAGVAEELVAGYALAAQGESRSEQSLALAAFGSKLNGVEPKAESLRRQAGVTRYRDSLGNAIEIATAEYVAASNIAVPQRLLAALAQPPRAASRRAGVDVEDDQPPPRSLWVLRNGALIGGVSFARSGEIRGKQLLAALRTENKRARTIYVSRGGHAKAQALGRAIGLEFSYGGLGRAAKAELIRGLGRQAIWIGDGTAPAASEPIAASAVSVSVAPLWRARNDAADILLPWTGLEGLPSVISLGRAHERRLARDYRAVYALNLLGVAGAFLAQFSSLQAGLLSNVGTWLVYARHARALDDLASTAEAVRARLTRSAVA
jgi:cation-transporting P-type ATPase C